MKRFFRIPDACTSILLIAGLLGCSSESPNSDTPGDGSPAASGGVQGEGGGVAVGGQGGDGEEPTGPSCNAAEAGSRPNLLFVMGDDHAAYALSSYGSQNVHTPNLDKLADQGVKFTSAYVNYPQCSASRASLLTGRFPPSAGVTQLQQPFPTEQYTIAEHLRDKEGYRTGAIGKMHWASTESQHREHGFDYRYWIYDPPDRPVERYFGENVKGFSVIDYKPYVWEAGEWLNAEYLPVGMDDYDMPGTRFVRKAQEFLAEPSDQPFVLWVSFHEPHSPFDFPVEYANHLDPAQMPAPELFPEDFPQVPYAFASLTDEEKRGIAASYYTSVAFLDKNIGQVLQALEDSGHAQDTLVVYVGDHGYFLGHHGRYEKHRHYEEAVRAPLIIRFPGRCSEGRTYDELVEFVDIVPSILDLMGFEKYDGLQGKSLMPLLSGESTEHRDHVFSMYQNQWDEAMIRTERYKLIYHKGEEPGDFSPAAGQLPPHLTRLYDMQEDPRESESLADDPDHQDVVDDLRHKLYERLLEAQPEGTGIPQGLSEQETIDLLIDRNWKPY